MQGRRDHGLVLQQSVPGRPLSSAQACKCNDSVIVHCCSLRDCRVCGRLLSPPAPAGVGRATAADGRLRGPSSPPLLLRYRHAAAVTASDGAGRSGEREVRRRRRAGGIPLPSCRHRRCRRMFLKIAWSSIRGEEFCSHSTIQGISFDRS